MKLYLHNLIKDSDPVGNLRFLDDNNILCELLPELVALKKVNRELKYKDNFYHTLGVLSNVVNANDSIDMRYIALFHDLGKAKTIKFINNKWTFHNHEVLSANMFKQLYKKHELEKFGVNYEKVYTIIKYHGLPKNLVDKGVTDSAVRRLHKETEPYFSELLQFACYDITTKDQDKKNKYIKQYNDVVSRQLAIEKADIEAAWQPQFRGNHIIELGITEGRLIGIIKNDIINLIKSGELEDNFDICKEYVIKKYNIK